MKIELNIYQNTIKIKKIHENTQEWLENRKKANFTEILKIIKIYFSQKKIDKITYYM